MRKIEASFKDIHPGYPIERIAATDRILFIDIETTGISRDNTSLYLIGCGFFDENGYHTVRWFADTPDEEPLLLDAFNDFARGRFTLLMHYNGDRFDIPYLSYKMKLHNRTNVLDSFDNFDIYKCIRPYKKLLGLPSLRQRSIEQLLMVNSDDPYTGRELISVYKEYVKHPSDELLEPLLYHNLEDLKGMAYILPILHYTNIDSMHLEYESHTAHPYRDYLGKECLELLVGFTHDADIPVGFNLKYDSIILSVRADGTALMRLPVFNGTLKRYYDNYRDYYYLPAEDCCVHKSVASGVDRNSRRNAKKETCYTKYSGLFIPAIPVITDAIFREDLKSSDLYTPYLEDCSSYLKKLGQYLIQYIFNN